MLRKRFSPSRNPPLLPKKKNRPMKVFKLSLFVLFSVFCVVFLLYASFLKGFQFTSLIDSSNPSKSEADYTNLGYPVQPDNVDSGEFDDVDNAPSHVCTRTCNGETKTCYYKFTIEQWVSMSEVCGDCANSKNPKISDCFKEFCVTADGFERSVLSINRKMPGPSIQVCKGDKIVVDVTNMLPGRSTALHWHGIRQRRSPHMDGVPMVTQCPIPEATSFRYSFTADDPGTHFYHSHDGLQKVDGVVGSLIVRVPKSEDLNKDLYDKDLPSHVILIQDWHQHIADEIFPGLRQRKIGQLPESFLIQGRGFFRNPDGSKLAETPLAMFTVTKDLRYVFRVIAGTCYQCQHVFKIDGHDLTIIEADGTSTEPYTVNSLTMSPGERFTVVVNCNQPQDSYWIQVQTTGYCKRNPRARQLGILKYDGHNGTPSAPEPDVNSEVQPGITVNPYESDCTEEEKKAKGPCAQDLRSKSKPTHLKILGKPDERIVWGFGMFAYDNQLPTTENVRYGKFIRAPKKHVAYTVNGAIFELPPSPLLSQYENVPKDKICHKGSFPPKEWNIKHHQCVYIDTVKSKKVVEIIMLDTVLLGMSHPIHLHGYDMYVIKQGQWLSKMEKGNQVFTEEKLSELMKSLTSPEKIPIPENPVAKDTIPLMAGGYAIVRIYTDNPGFWMFHCHFAYHLDSGMAGVLQVGNPPERPKGFPLCGNYLPQP